MSQDNTDVDGIESVSPSKRNRLVGAPVDLSSEDAQRLGQAAYEAFQGSYLSELSDTTRQNAPSKQAVPTRGRAAWKMLDRNVQETWARVARAVAAGLR